MSFCINKMWTGRILPAIELYYVNEADNIQIVDIHNKDRSAAGIEAFLEENGVIDVRLDPSKILERTGRKFLEII